RLRALSNCQPHVHSFAHGFREEKRREEKRREEKRREEKRREEKRREENQRRGVRLIRTESKLNKPERKTNYRGC
ncbi:hypothetical protein QQF64_030290, partial [Cirrhinus molitorella]